MELGTASQFTVFTSYASSRIRVEDTARPALTGPGAAAAPAAPDTRPVERAGRGHAAGFPHGRDRLHRQMDHMLKRFEGRGAGGRADDVADAMFRKTGSFAEVAEFRFSIVAQQTTTISFAGAEGSFAFRARFEFSFSLNISVGLTSGPAQPTEEPEGAPVTGTLGDTEPSASLSGDGGEPTAPASGPALPASVPASGGVADPVPEAGDASVPAAETVEPVAAPAGGFAISDPFGFGSPSGFNGFVLALFEAVQDFLSRANGLAEAEGEQDGAVTVSVSDIYAARGGRGDDRIEVTAERVRNLRGGRGDDAISVSADSVRRVSGGRGDDAIAVAAQDVRGISGGRGNDAISVSAEQVRAVSGGRGDDAISVAAAAVRGVSGGRGNDAVSVSAERVRAVSGGRGDDDIAVAGASVRGVFGGRGDDDISVSAQKVAAVSGGRGDDSIAVSGQSVEGVFGGRGDDEISVTGGEVNRLSGGAGDDTITVEAAAAFDVSGGAGDDFIFLSTDDASLAFDAGDGSDEVVLKAGGNFAVKLGESLASSADDVEITDLGGGDLELSFDSGESLRLTGAGLAGSVSLEFADGVRQELVTPEIAPAPLDVAI